MLVATKTSLDHLYRIKNVHGTAELSYKVYVDIFFRFQIQRKKGDPNNYKGLGDCFKTIIRTEGVYGFYKGILPPILAETPKTAVKVTGNTFDLSLNSSLKPYMWSIYFSLVFSKKPVIHLGSGSKSMVLLQGYQIKSCTANIKVKHCLQFMRTFAIGLVSGTVSSCVNIPFDVAKSRIQGPQSVPGEIKYRSCFQTMALVYRLIPKIMRLGPGGAVMLLVYEYVSDWLQKNL
uniref:Mitochondrial 2-oxodicarboxylate carrier n=1 Tax=Sinocyclocheilus grahami TaxID=75366 RepID=A0A672JZR8_SINGR